MNRVTSADGTRIAFERSGDGPPVVLVGAGRAMYRPLAKRLAEHFAVFNYDRRGRGESGDTPPYAVEREIEDLAAVVTEAGGAASVYGHSSGAALALLAAARGLPIDRLVLHEPPYASEDDEAGKRASRELAEKTKGLLAEGRPGDAIAHIFSASATGIPREMVDDLLPVSVEDLSRDERLLAMARTFAYDLEAINSNAEGTAPTDVANAVFVPALVLTDGSDYPWVIGVGKQLADAMPEGRHGILEAQDPGGQNLEDRERYADPEVLASVVATFFLDRDDGPERAGR